MAFWLRYINPNTFSDTKSNDFLATLVTGGTNSITGPVLAAVLVTGMLEGLRALVNWRLVIYGLLYVVIMRFRPEGLLGYKEFSLKGTIHFFKELPTNIKQWREKLLQRKEARKKGDQKS